LVPFTLVGLFNVRFALLAANALEANVRANPTTRLFDTVANFIAAPLLSPKISDLVRGGPVREQREKTLVFRRESPHNAAAGVERKPQACDSALGVFSPGPPNRV
jgi:hypothetical protein